jgi:hypothetical protein
MCPGTPLCKDIGLCKQPLCQQRNMPEFYDHHMVIPKFVQKYALNFVTAAQLLGSMSFDGEAGKICHKSVDAILSAG